MSDWIEHDGDDCPFIPGTLVDVKYRDGEVIEELPALHYGAGPRDASYSFWEKDGMPSDIVAYRIIEQPEKDDISKDCMKIYCDNFLALSTALECVGGNPRAVLPHQHEFLQLLARNGIELKAIIHPNAGM